MAQSTVMLEDKVLSLNDLMKFEDQDLKKITFEIVETTSNIHDNEEGNLQAFKQQNM